MMKKLKRKIFKLKYLLFITLFAQCYAEEVKKEKSFLKLSSNDIQMQLSGFLQEKYFFYHRVRTLSDNFYDQNDFFRHKLNLDFNVKQGEKKFGKPSSEAGVRLTNYVVWQQNDYYMPFSRDPLRSQDLDSVITVNQYDVKTLMPLIFLEEAWLKINFDTFARTFNKNATFLKAGFFLYEVGRGLSLGYHNDLAVEYMGWPGVGNFTRYPQMPPGILFSSQILKNLSGDIYFMKWREVDANLEDVMYPSRAQRLGIQRTERGANKDRYNLSIKFDYTPEERDYGKILLEPYWVYTHAPELSVEFESDSKAFLHTLGLMMDYDYGNFHVNCELAGQFGDQTMFAIDRNIELLSKTSSGLTQEVFSHITQQNPTYRQKVPVRVRAGGDTNANSFVPQDSLLYIVNLPINRDIRAQGQAIQGAELPGVNKTIYNSNLFGNARFRNEYKLEHQGVMALLDVSYDFKKLPINIAGALGYISGDEYPFNDENSKTYHGFIPMRSRYNGLSVKNTLIFDRLVLPRPLNIDYRTMYAHDNLKDLANLQFFGAGLTWYPFKEKRKCLLNSDLMFFWESGRLYKWDKNGHHPDPEIESQIAFDRAYLGFPGVTPRYDAKTTTQDPTNKGWLSNETASRFLGAELDLRAEYKPIKDCSFSGQVCLFFPGQLFTDLEGQPNILTQYVDNLGLSHYESLGDKFAYSFIVGIDYKF